MLYDLQVELETIDLEAYLGNFIESSQRQEKMARIAVRKSAIPLIGKAFGEAASDPAKRRALVADPVAYLKAAGIADEDLEGLELVVHEDAENTVNLVLPHSVDEARVRNGDHEYLKMLGTMAVLGCMRPIY